MIANDDGTPRDRLLAGLPVTDLRLQLDGVATAVLAGGSGPPVVLLHEPGSFAAHWLHAIPELADAYRVVAPDLPGHGASEAAEGEVNAGSVLAWLDALIYDTCHEQPALVGHLGSGAIAARYAIEHRERLRSLVLVDTFGLAAFRPAPGFALALFRYIARPTARTHAGLMHRCTADYAGLRGGLGERWEPFAAYTLEGARSPSGKAALRAIMRELAVPVIPAAALGRIAVPTTLIWGRQDPVNRLRVAEAASARHGWPLHVIENAGDDAPLEQPREFIRVLRAALSSVAA